jgi:hypothetical protein
MFGHFFIFSHVSVKNIFDLNKMRIGLKSYEIFYVRSKQHYEIMIKINK